MNRTRTITVCILLSFCAAGALGDAESDFDSLFGEDVKRVTASRNTKEAAELAAQMLKTAGSVANRPDLDLVIWRYAAELGAKDPSGFITAIAAIRKLVKVAPTDAHKWVDKLSAIYRRRYSLARGDDRFAVGSEQVDDFVAIGDVQAAAGKSYYAMSTYRRALSTATLIRSPRKTEILAKIKTANIQVAQEREFDRLTKALAANPDDARTRAALVRMQLTEFNRPAEAIKLLNDDMDEMTRTYVPLAVRQIDELEGGPCLELGRWYWEMYPTAKTDRAKTTVLARTRDYLDRFSAQDTAKGTDKLRAMLIMKQVDAETAKLVAKGATVPGVLTKATVLYDFETLQMTGWRMTGNAFGKGPCTGKPTPEYPAVGFVGKGMISSYHQGDDSLGALSSPKFLIRGKSITFHVGGGNYPGETCINLMIGDKIARTSVGNMSNTMTLTGWDVSDLVGKTAWLQMIDKKKGHWGHILIDHIVQHPGKLETLIKTPPRPKEPPKKKPHSKEEWRRRKEKMERMKAEKHRKKSPPKSKR